jgi:hypothetical protein
MTRSPCASRVQELLYGSCRHSYAGRSFVLDPNLANAVVYGPLGRTGTGANLAIRSGGNFQIPEKIISLAIPKDWIRLLPNAVKTDKLHLSAPKPLLNQVWRV